MPGSSAARRILDTAMRHDPDDTPEARFDASLEETERDPRQLARQARIASLNARRPLHPLYGGSALGLAIVAMGLVIVAAARWVGWI